MHRSFHPRSRCCCTSCSTPIIFASCPAHCRTPACYYGIARQNELYPPDAYVLKNVQEYFAVTGSLYLWGNVDRPPFNRTTLHDKQPLYYQWLGDLFGVQKKA